MCDRIATDMCTSGDALCNPWLAARCCDKSSTHLSTTLDERICYTGQLIAGLPGLANTSRRDTAFMSLDV